MSKLTLQSTVNMDKIEIDTQATDVVSEYTKLMGWLYSHRRHHVIIVEKP